MYLAIFRADENGVERLPTLTAKSHDSSSAEGANPAFPMRALLRSEIRTLAAVLAAAFLPCIAFPGVDRDRLEDADFPRTVTIVFDGTGATVTDTDGAGVSVTRGSTDSALAITSGVEGVCYVLSGSASPGYVQITSSTRCKVVLNGLSLTATDGPALSVISTADSFLVIADGSTNSLADTASKYSRTGKGLVYTGGALMVSGRGTLNLSSACAHGIFTTGYLRVFEGVINVTAAASDAIHPKTYFRQDGGTLIMTPTGDGIDASSGIVIDGGRICFTSASADVKAVKTDGTLEILGGTIDATISGDQSKGLSAGGDIAVAGGALFFNLSGGVVLEEATAEDSSTYYDPSYCTAIKGDGDIAISDGHIVVTHTGTAGKGISVDGTASVSGGSLDIAVSGGSSASYVNAEGETDTATPTAVKADGNLTITGGTFKLALLSASAGGLSTDGILTISDGTFAVTATGNQSKGLKSDASMFLSGGTFNFAMSGGVVLEASGSYYDPSYCTAIKSEGDLTVSGGTFAITHSGTAGKGVSVDGNIVMTGGTFNIANSGGVSATYYNTDGALDMASSDCFKADGNLTITGGTLNAANTGTGGDAVSCDGAAVIGTLGVSSTPAINVSTSGVHVLLSGSGENADYVNAKAFSAEGNLTMNGGTFTAKTVTEGGEGMESKSNLTINGGTIEINSYDDAINAATSITINGGNIYCYASNNDGIDSNGTLTITGGTIVSSGTSAPEEGLDCDQNTFKITGGLLIGTGGATSTPTAASCTQRSVIYKGTGTANVILQIKSSSGSVLVYKLPRTYSGGMGGPGGSSAAMTLLFSSPSLASGTTYTILSGATVTGGTEFHGLYTGATVSGGTTLKTFNPTSMVTTVQ